MPESKIKSSTGSAKIVKQGHTTSGKHGTGVSSKSNTTAKEIGPKG